MSRDSNLVRFSIGVVSCALALAASADDVSQPPVEELIQQLGDESFEKRE